MQIYIFFKKNNLTPHERYREEFEKPLSKYVIEMYMSSLLYLRKARDQIKSIELLAITTFLDNIHTTTDLVRIDTPNLFE